MLLLILGVAAVVIVVLLVACLAIWARWKRVAGEKAAEQAKGFELEQGRGRAELELASLRPEANRWAQGEVERLKLQDEVGELGRRCSTVDATLAERDKAMAAERSSWREMEAGLNGEIAQLRMANEADRNRMAELREKVAGLTVTLEERVEAAKAERETFEELKEQTRLQFIALAAEALKNNGEAFLDNAKRVLALQHNDAGTDLTRRQEEIKQLVKPINDSLKAISDAAQEMESKRERTFGTLEEQIRQSIANVAEVGKQASALKDALKKPNVRGRWGEVQLKNCIDLAGMDEHCDVTFQDSEETVHAERIRPDMTVRMPGGRRVVVDSKAPMEFFLRYMEAQSDEERRTALVRHAATVKTHVSGLVKSDYMQKAAGSPDFVIMFLPNESFLAMALEYEPALMEEALLKKVLIATPGTLIGLLKVIRYGWNEQKIAENAARIAEAGGKLSTEIVRFSRITRRSAKRCAMRQTPITTAQRGWRSRLWGRRRSCLHWVLRAPRR